MLLSLLILLMGALSLGFLIKSYQERLLVNIHQKLWMTGALIFTFSLIFFLGNFLLYLWIKTYFQAHSLAEYAAHPGFLIQVGLGCFILNAILVLAVRSLLKVIYRLRN